ncbi:hypothetical protein L5515_010035 [Caenorhabditis briggsae]|uniref:CUB-like domain-containing protein n=1 Tax=Caenorhabditis briggsae TaxID=6238 RepID=A0AAE9JFC3_CAEBR|nr:hypothetical protein L5515_010035 [Caenorhabditis briggsae]
MHSLFVPVFFLLFGYSCSLECSSQEVNFTPTNTSFKILSDENDLTSKTCKYTFSVPKNYVPTVTFWNVALTGDNKITLKQYSEWGGTKTYDIKSTIGYTLAPLNFTIEINLPKITAGDTFVIDIRVRDATPAATGETFLVQKDIGTLIDSFNIRGNSSILQSYDAENPQAASYSIKIVIFTDINLFFDGLSKIHVYDSGLYKGSLYDVYASQTTCMGTQFAIVNTNPFTVDIFTVLISEKYEWSENPVSVSALPRNTTKQYLTATNGPTVFHEISSELNEGSYTPSMYQQISFRGDGELKVYAGCVTNAQESKRIATITPANAGNWDNLRIYGRCKTAVLTKGVVQWTFSNTFPTSFYHKIGQQGVIMNNAFPYASPNNVTFMNYLIQHPSENTKENIIVTYEVAQMASDVSFEVQQEIKYNENKTTKLTASDTSFTSVSTYQQYIVYSLPQRSTGFLVRYTVASSSSCLGVLFVFFFIGLFNVQ